MTSTTAADMHASWRACANLCEPPDRHGLCKTLV